MSFYPPEYRHLLAAERSLACEIKEPGEKTNIAALAKALVEVIRLKRDMRGCPNPRPVDVAPKGYKGRVNSGTPGRIHVRSAQIIDVPSTAAPDPQTATPAQDQTKP